MKMNKIKMYCVLAAAAFLLTGCACLKSSSNTHYSVDIASNADVAFRHVHAEEVNGALAVSGRVHVRETTPLRPDQICVTLETPGGTVIESQRTRLFSVNSSGASQTPESKFIARFETVPAGEFTVQVKPVE